MRTTQASPSSVLVTSNAPEPPQVDFRAVLVPLDGSRMAERALETARWLAERFDTELHVLSGGVHWEETGWYKRYLDTIAAGPHGASTHAVAGRHAASAICTVAGRLEPCLVCMTTHGRARGAALLGSTFTTVATARRAPLVAVGPRALFPTTGQPGRILACVDGGPPSEQVLPVAAAWARRLDMRLSVAIVAEPSPPVILPRSNQPPHRHRPAEPEAYIESLLERPELDGVKTDGLVIWDPISPQDGLVDHLQEEPATLIAAASHLRTGAGRALHGSAAAKIIHRSPIPVLVQPLALAPPVSPDR